MHSFMYLQSKLRAYIHSWNPDDCSRNIYVKPSGFTLHRNPVAQVLRHCLRHFFKVTLQPFANPFQSTDGGRGRLGFRHGRHAWEVIWEGPLGTVAVIGIATKDAPNQVSNNRRNNMHAACLSVSTNIALVFQCHGYVALLGSNDQSWGWNLVDNHLLHNGDSQGNYPQLNNAPKYQVQRFGMFQWMDLLLNA